MNHLRILALAAVVAAAAHAQTMVEHSLGTARAAGSAAGMRSTGKATAGILENAAKTLEKANSTAASSSTVVLAAAPDDSAKPVKFTAPDPAQIKPGMEASELIKKFGEPAMKISGELDTWTYGSDPGAVTVKLREGKVFSVTPPSAKKKETSADSSPSNTAVTVLR